MKGKRKLISALLATTFVAGFTGVLIPALTFGSASSSSTSTTSDGETTYNLTSSNISDKVSQSLLSSSELTEDVSDNTNLTEDDEVIAIVRLEGQSIMDKYLDRNPSVDISDYVKTSTNQLYAKNLVSKQEDVYENISKYALGSITNNYTTILNGFSVKVKYGDISKIENTDGVSSVIVSEKYEPASVEESDSSVVTNDVNVYSTGIYNSSNVSYTGKNTIVAILDTGLDYTHSAFQEMPEGEVSYTKDEISQIVSYTAAASLSASKTENAFTLTTNDVYISKKVPWAYDYADKDNNVYPVNDHGTHVAGIIAGHDDTITGVATQAQLAIMKVFSDKDQGAQTADILAALQDCIVLNVDVANMSLGSSCGFATSEDEDQVDEIYENVRKSGVSLICAASNDYSAAQGSDNGDTNLTSNPDSGTVGSPSSYAAAMSVASISGVKTPYFKLGDETIYWTESSTTNGDKKEFINELLGDKTSATYEYVVVPGTGSSSDYLGLDVNGKIAVVKRGVNTFEDKILTAKSKGAIGIIIYNNQSGNISMSVGNSQDVQSYPACSITMDSGKFFEKAKTGSITFDKNNLAGPFMSDFSSWGVLPNLELKPDITAHGGDILSAVRGGYERYSGTSMACPNMAGATTLVRQYVKELHPDWTRTEISNLTYQLLMSTATIAQNQYGNPYSPRKQGAGIADIKKATTTSAYLWVEGSNKTKISLGDDAEKTGHYTLTFNITNISNTAQTYKVSPSVFTETVSSDGKTVAERAYMFNDYKWTFDVTGATKSGDYINLKGYDSATITVTIDLSDEDKAYLDANFVNGMFVEGFISLENADTEGVDLNIPYCGFYGDWTVAPIFDYTVYEIAESQEDSSVLDDDKLKAAGYATTPLGGFASSQSDDGIGAYGLGVYGYYVADGYTQPYAKEDKAAITQNSNGFYMLYGVNAGFLRGTKRLEIVIKDATTGDIVYQGTKYNGRKSHYSSGSRTGGYVQLNLTADEYGLKNNTKYSFEMVGYLDWDGEQKNLKNTFSFDFYVDSEAPVLLDNGTRVKIKEDSSGNKKYYLQMDVYDNHYIECYSIATYDSIASDGTYVNEEQLIRYTIPVDMARGTTTTIELDITDYWNDLLKQNKKFAVQFIDYARNTSTYTFDLPQTLATSIQFNKTSHTIKANATYDLFDIITMNPTDSHKYLIEFSSSNEEIVRVQDGEIYGVSEGTATVTATAPNGQSATIEIVVKGKKSGTPTLKSIDLGRSTLKITQGDEYTVTAKLEPWYFDSSNTEVTWTVNNNAIATVTPSEDGRSATIKGISSGTTIVSARSGKFIISNLTVTVKEEFEIESRILKSYNGRGDENGVVTIPDDEGITAIYQYAFYDNDYITKIIVPEGVTTIYQAAIYGCENLEEIVLPSTCESIENYGIGWNPKLVKVTLGGTKSIKNYGFVQNTSLTDIDLSKVNTIGNGAFYRCSSLKSIDISNCGNVCSMAFAYCTSLTDVKMSTNTSLLGTQAFYRCTGLTSLTLPVSFVAEGTFAYCTALTDVTFLNDVSTIGDSAFAGCSQLESVTYLGEVNTIGEQTFRYCTSLKEAYLPNGLEVLGNLAFANDTSLENVIIANGAKLTSINQVVFYGDSKLVSYTVETGNKYLSTDADGILYDKSQKELLLVPAGTKMTTYTVPSNVLVIKANAFSGITTLESIDLNNVVTIDDAAFISCSNLKTVTWSENLETIGSSAFNSCSNLDASVFDLSNTNIKSIGSYAFAASGSASTLNLVIPASVEELGDYVFAQVSGLTTVKFADDVKVTSIPNYAFAYNTSLTNVDFSNVKLTEVGSYVFYNDTALTTVTYPTTGIVSFGTHNYYNCSSIEEIKTILPRTITEIPSYTFYGCTSITGAKVTSNITKIGSYAFAGSGVATATFATVTEIGDYAFAQTSLTSISESGAKKLEKIGSYAFAAITALQNVSLPAVTEIGEGAFYQDTALLAVSAPKATVIGNLAFYGATAVKTYNLPLAEEIGEGAFYQNKALTKISLPSAKTIGELAFYYTALTTFEIPASLEKLGERAFIAATSLKNFTVEEGTTTFFVSDGVLYRNLTNKYYELEVYPYAKTSTTYTVLENTVRIAAGAFYATPKLTSIELPTTLTHIGFAAFYGTNITTYKFHSYVAPTLESNYQSSSSYSTYYANFVTSIVDTDTLSELKLSLEYPSNGTGYDSYLYNQYFTTKTKTTEVAPNTDVLTCKNLIANFPDTITLADYDNVVSAYTLYKNFKANMKAFITSEEVAKLEAAYAAIQKLMA